MFDCIGWKVAVRSIEELELSYSIVTECSKRKYFLYLKCKVRMGSKYSAIFWSDFFFWDNKIFTSKYRYWTVILTVLYLEYIFKEKNYSRCEKEDLINKSETHALSLCWCYLSIKSSTHCLKIDFLLNLIPGHIGYFVIIAN